VALLEGQLDAVGAEVAGPHVAVGLAGEHEPSRQAAALADDQADAPLGLAVAVGRGGVGEVDRAVEDGSGSLQGPLLRHGVAERPRAEQPERGAAHAEGGHERDSVRGDQPSARSPRRGGARASRSRQEDAGGACWGQAFFVPPQVLWPVYRSVGQPATCAWGGGCASLSRLPRGRRSTTTCTACAIGSLFGPATCAASSCTDRRARSPRRAGPGRPRRRPR